MDLGISDIVKSLAEAGPVQALGDAWQAVIGDRIAHWRMRNAMALQIRANEEANRLGLKIDRARIPERYAIAWFEEATKQDEPELQTLFARLLARAASGDEDAKYRRHIEIMSRLTPVDAAIFDRVYSKHPFPGTGAYESTQSILEPSTLDRTKMGWPRDWAQALIENFHPGQAAKSIEHLIVVGLLTVTSYVEGDRNAGTLPSPLSEAGRRKTSWRKFVQAHAATRPYLVGTELGRSLKLALR